MKEGINVMNKEETKQELEMSQAVLFVDCSR